MKSVFYFLLMVFLGLLDTVLVILLWVPIRLIWGVNTLKYVFSPATSLSTWLQTNLKR